MILLMLRLNAVVCRIWWRLLWWVLFVSIVVIEVIFGVVVRIDLLVVVDSRLVCVVWYVLIAVCDMVGSVGVGGVMI